MTRKSLCSGSGVPLQNTGFSYAVPPFYWLPCKKMSRYIRYCIWSHFLLVSLSIRYSFYFFRSLCHLSKAVYNLSAVSFCSLCCSSLSAFGVLQSKCTPVFANSNILPSLAFVFYLLRQSEDDHHEPVLFSCAVLLYCENNNLIILYLKNFVCFSLKTIHILTSHRSHM